MLSGIVVAILVISFFWAFYRLALPWAWGILKKPPTASNVISISNEQRRWVVIGVCLTKVLTPALRTVLANEMPKWYNGLCQPPTKIDKQVYGRHQKKLPPSTLTLNYKNINNNDAHKSPSAFDYQVKDYLSLARLFLQPFMSKFTGFDQTMDVSAVLSVIGEAAPLTGAAVHAKAVRSDIRNEWAHCNFANWTEPKFKAAFQCMETLLKNVNLSTEEEQKLCDELNFWRSKGLQLCFNWTENTEILTSIRDQFDELCQAVKTWNLGNEEMRKLLTEIPKMKSDLSKEIDSLRTRVKECEKTVANNDKKVERMEEQLKNQLSRSHDKEEEKIPHVFSAPPRNRHFAGRTKEIQELERILKVEETLNTKKVRVAAVCGLGGIGKTSLVSEYAHRRKDFYKGGVYWFSAEDDTRLSKTVNSIAVKIGALLDSFELTLPNIMKKISTTLEPCLIVLDCLDQLDLSSDMMEFLSFPSEESICGHFIVLTRRNPNLLANQVSVIEEDSCLPLKCFRPEEAKEFIFSRTSTVNPDKNLEGVVECLCEKLGRLPLAMEQAGAYIKMRGCSFSKYLEQYETESVQLLRRERARNASNDSSERLAVHTTWRLNMEYIKNESQYGQAAVRFMNACSFFDGNEIEEELINVGQPKVEDDAFCECVSSPLGCHEVLKLLTDFSLFTYVQAHSIRTHRLVQELVRKSFNATERAESFADAVRMLSHAFSKCSSPSSLVSSNEMNGEEQQISITNLPSSPYQFYLWSKFCVHGHYLRKEMETLLVSSDSVKFPETSKVLYECAVHLSANHKQEEAKRALNFAYRMLDWLPMSACETVQKIVSNNSLFPLPIPLPKPIQMAVKGCCVPSFPALQSLTGAPDSGSSISDSKMKIQKLRSDGKTSYNEGRYEEALAAYSNAIKLAGDCNNACFDPLLLTNRATVYIKLKQYEDALKDANDYITRCPECWKGYARKALALYGLKEPVSAEIAAALALFYKSDVFSYFERFEEFSLHVKQRIFICGSVDQLHAAISKDVKGLKILILGSDEYILNFATVDKPWNNCVLVGTRKDRSVALKSTNNINLLKCSLTNLSFCFNEGHIFCGPDSDVKMLNCNFGSHDAPLATVESMGKLTAEQCNFTSSNGSGLSCCSETGNAVVDDCSFFDNGINGVTVTEKATLAMKSSRMYNNGFSGLAIHASKCVAINCAMERNGDGIYMLLSKDVELIRNSVFGNHGMGIFVFNSEVNISENSVFDNGLWGIWCQSNSQGNISFSRIFRNNAGGVGVGYQTEESVIGNNKIYDNSGPAFAKILIELGVIDVISRLRIQEDLSKWIVKSHDNEMIRKSPAFPKFCHNEEYNNKESEKLNLCVPYCSNCRKDCKPRMCKKCFTAGYCDVACRDEHLPKHETICEVLREKSSYLVSLMKEPEPNELIEEQIEGLKIKSKTRPPRKRFIVKVRSATTLDNRYRLMLYDQKFRLHKTFDSKCIKELVKEFGVLCERQGLDKKLYFYCVSESNGGVRLFTNEFPGFQSW